MWRMDRYNQPVATATATVVARRGGRGGDHETKNAAQIDDHRAKKKGTLAEDVEEQSVAVCHLTSPSTIEIHRFSLFSYRQHTLRRYHYGTCSTCSAISAFACKYFARSRRCACFSLRSAACRSLAARAFDDDVRRNKRQGEMERERKPHTAEDGDEFRQTKETRHLSRHRVVMVGKMTT